MSLIFYHYVHCPFCVRVRMALGFLNIAYESRVLPYDDDETPVRLTGKKMLPILQDQEKAINESLDIIAHCDKENKLRVKEVQKQDHFPPFEKLLSEIGNPIHSLAMPYWIWTPEFDQSSREYFRQKKEGKRGPFAELYFRRREFMKELEPKLDQLVKELGPFYQSSQFGIYDIMLASHLWGLYVVPEFQFPPRLHDYLQEVRRICSFDYHKDFWR